MNYGLSIRSASSLNHFLEIKKKGIFFGQRKYERKESPRQCSEGSPVSERFYLLDLLDEAGLGTRRG